MMIGVFDDDIYKHVVLSIFTKLVFRRFFIVVEVFCHLCERTCSFAPRGALCRYARVQWNAACSKVSGSKAKSLAVKLLNQNCITNYLRQAISFEHFDVSCAEVPLEPECQCIAAYKGGYTSVNREQAACACKCCRLFSSSVSISVKQMEDVS